MNLLKDLDISGKRVFVRADLDVPLDGLDQVHNKLENETATRLTNLKKTIDFIFQKGAKQVIIAGHIGRPEKPDPNMSTKLLLPVLENILGKQIGFCDQLEVETDELVVLLENLRFWPGETANDGEFAKKLAALSDCYVNEAFGNSHRAHASMVSLPALLPHAAGLHLEQEVEVMTRLLETPEKPFISIVGGAKIETKVPVITNLSKISHNVLVGGALPLEIEKENLKFPENVLVAKLTEDKKDIDLESTHRFMQHIRNAKTVAWNGPMGLFEEGFETGTKSLAAAILESGAYSVVGGGDTTQFLEKIGLLPRFSFVSAGGGAMLDFLAGEKLPALAALG